MHVMFYTSGQLLEEDTKSFTITHFDDSGGFGADSTALWRFAAEVSWRQFFFFLLVDRCFPNREVYRT